MGDDIISVLTAKSVATILALGGSQSWTLNRSRAMACRYAVVCRNARHADVEGPEPHGSAFMVGKVSDIVPSTELEGRWMIRFSAYALVALDDQWVGRNPVRFWKTDDFGDIDFERLQWKPVTPSGAGQAEISGGAGLTIAEAKAGLSVTFGVDPAAIEIIIRG